MKTFYTANILLAVSLFVPYVAATNGAVESKPCKETKDFGTYGYHKAPVYGAPETSKYPPIEVPGHGSPQNPPAAPEKSPAFTSPAISSPTFITSSVAAPPPSTSPPTAGVPSNIEAPSTSSVVAPSGSSLFPAPAAPPEPTKIPVGAGNYTISLCQAPRGSAPNATYCQDFKMEIPVGKPQVVSLDKKFSYAPFAGTLSHIKVPDGVSCAVFRNSQCAVSSVPSAPISSVASQPQTTPSNGYRKARRNPQTTNVPATQPSSSADGYCFASGAGNANETIDGYQQMPQAFAPVQGLANAVGGALDGALGMVGNMLGKTFMKREDAPMYEADHAEYAATATKSGAASATMSMAWSATASASATASVPGVNCIKCGQIADMVKEAAAGCASLTVSASVSVTASMTFSAFVSATATASVGGSADSHGSY